MKAGDDKIRIRLSRTGASLEPRRNAAATPTDAACILRLLSGPNSLRLTTLTGPGITFIVKGFIDSLSL